VPQSLAAYQARLAERLREALGTADDDRVRAELAVFAAKIDVDEELERLRAHLARPSAPSSRAGRSASGSTSSPRNSIARPTRSLEGGEPAAVGLRARAQAPVEQVREQVQNIE